MTAQIINGREVADSIFQEVAEEAAQMKAQHGIVPGLSVVLVGEDPASVSYVTGKDKACARVGFRSYPHKIPSNYPEIDLITLVHELNKHPDIDGILVQVPLPKHIDETKVLLAIDPEKDVDGFHPFNLGRLILGQETYKPCTPAGIQELLLRSGAQIEGADVVIVGRSNIVGKPIAVMLFQKAAGANATVTVTHTRTRDLASHTRRADILIVAAGKPRGVTADMIKPGATVIDVGVNRMGYTKEGKAKLCGDVDFAAACEVAGRITPVPGGVGPMTIAMLMKNTLKSAKRRIKD